MATLPTVAGLVTKPGAGQVTPSGIDTVIQGDLAPLAAAEAADASSISSLTTAEAHLASLVTLSTAAPFAYPDGSGALRAGAVLPASLFHNGTLDLTSLMGTASASGTSTSGTSTSGTGTSGTGTSTGGTSTTGTGTSTGGTATAAAPPPVPAFGAAPSASGSPPTIYQVVSAQNVSGSSFGTTLTATLGTLTAGSHVAVLVNGSDGVSNAAKATISTSGLAKLADQVHATGWVAGWFGPSASLSGLAITLGALTGIANMAVIETNAASLDLTWGALGGVGTTSKLYTPTAASPASATAIVLAKTNENSTMSLASGTALATYPGVVAGGIAYHAGLLAAVPAGSSSAITLTTANGNTSPSSATCALTANFYSTTLAGGGNTAATPVVVGGATPTPAVIPPPAGGYAPYHQRDLAAVAQGKQPRFTLGMFGASYVQGWRRLALATYAIGFAQARLDFTSYDNPSTVYGSTQYAGRKNAAQGVTDKLLCISFMPWSSSSFIGDVAAGNYDAQFQGLADDLIANGSARVRLRVTWELNEQYYYSVDIHNCPDQFVAAIRRVVWLMTSRPGAQFTIGGPAPILVAGADSNGDPTNFLTGADATGDLSSDNYYTSFLDNQGALTTATPARIASIRNAIQNATTGSTSWQAKHAKQYGVPLGYGEGASCGTRRNDGHGIGDIAELMTAYADECLITDPVAYLMWWMDNGGGTDSIVTPVTGWPNSSNFPATYEVFKARFGTPQADPDVANGAIPQAPGLTASFANGVLTLATTKASGDTVNYTVKQVAIPGTHVWTTWNDVLAGDTVASNGMDSDVDNSPVLPPGFVAGGLLDCRAFNSNTLGNSPWTQVRINTATGAQVGSTVSYASTYGLNEDGTCGPTLLANEIPPTGTIGSGAASTAAVSVQKGTAVFAYGATSETVTLPKAATAGNHVVLCYIGYSGNLADLVAPSGFTRIVSRALGVSQGGALWFGPVSALVNNGITLSGAATTDQGLLILEETTGGYIEFAGQNGSYGRDSFSVNGMMTASQGRGAQSMAMAWDTAGAAVSTSVGTIDFTASGASYGGFVYHSFASLTLPTGTHGPVNVGTVYNSGAPLTPEKPGYLCWTTYTSAPPVIAQPTLAQFCAAAGVVASVPYGTPAASGTGTSTGGTTTSTSGTTTSTGGSTPTGTAGSGLRVQEAKGGYSNGVTSATFTNAAASGDTVLAFFGEYDHTLTSLPAGATSIASGNFNSVNGYVDAFSAPASALTGNRLTLPGAPFGTLYLLETTAKRFEGSVIGASGNTTNTLVFTPIAAGAGADRLAMLFFSVGAAVVPTVSGATLLDYTMGPDGSGARATVLVSIPANSTSVTVTTGNSGATGIAVVSVNAYPS